MYLNRNNSICMDKVFINAVIYTIGMKNYMYQAMGVKDGKITVLGTNDEVMMFVGKYTEVLDLKGKCILPGFIDPYSCIPEDLVMKNGISLFDYNNTDDYIRIVKQFLEKSDNNIIWCTGWRCEDEFSCRGQWINRVECNKPIVAIDCNNEVMLLNRNAVRYFEITKNRIPPVGGEIEIKLDDNSIEYAFLKEMLDSQALIKDITGESPTILRFPCGCNNTCYKLKPELVDLLHKNNLKIFDWNVDTTDGANPYASPSTFINKAKSDKDTIFLLMNCGYQSKNSVKALPEIIKYYKDKGYSFKAIDDDTPEQFHYIKK